LPKTKPDASQIREYDSSDTMLMTRLIDDLNNKITTKGVSFAQLYLIQKGLQVFGQEGCNASMKEMDHLHCQNCFTLTSIADMLPIERRRAQQALMFLTPYVVYEKRGKVLYYKY
jgi:hypothetical protein